MFKEWAVVVDALGSGDQIIILRKGGINEGRGGFRVEHEQFFLFPTLFHQQRDSVLPTAQLRFDEIHPTFPPADQIRLEFFVRVTDWRRLETLAEAEAIRGQHIWRDEVVAQRFDWGRDQSIYAMAVRVHRLPAAVDLPMLPGYGGCKSWVELDGDLSTEGATPVLSDADFTRKLETFRAALEPVSR